MSKKYLTLEEAARKIGIDTAELNRLREKGTIRAFADRGSWKFKEDDVSSLLRSRQADSDPEVPLQFGAASDEPSDLLFSDEDSLGGEPTVLGRGSDDSSDSDVRLIFDDGTNLADSKGESEEDSDSDVKLAGNTAPASDAGSDSDVKLVSEEPTVSSGSDSDVRLVSSDSSGEVKLVESGSGDDVGPDSGKYPGPVSKDTPLSSSGDVAALKEGDSGISLAHDSGISLAGDSGISLDQGHDSGIALASDSGISLERPNDSGISLSEESSIVGGDSGIALSPESPIKKGRGKKPAKPADDDLTGTVPLMDLHAADDDILETQMEVPMLDDSSDDSRVGAGGGDTTSVIALDDEDEYSVSSSKKAGDSDDELFAGDDEEVAVEEADEDLDVSDEVVGEDDELGEDVFGAEDEDFSDQIESGESVSELPVSRGLAAPVAQDWGTPVFVGLAMSALLMVLCGTVMFDIVRNMWHADMAGQNPVASTLLGIFGGS